MKTFADRLKFARKLRRMSQADLAQRAGVAQSTIGNIEAGRGQSARDLASIAAALEVEPIWLHLGRGQMPNEQNEDPIPRVDFRRGDSPRSFNIPLLDARASMGAGAALADYVDILQEVSANTVELRKRVSFSSPQNLRLLTAYGDSMAPTFSDGDILLIDVGIAELNVDAVYVLQRDDELYCKRIQRRPTGGYRMISDNPVYPPEDIDPDRDGFRVLARVVCVWNMRKL